MEANIKTYRVGNGADSACYYLMIRKVAFSYNEENGFTFEATEEFVKEMRYRLACSYGVRDSKITEVTTK